MLSDKTPEQLRCFFLLQIINSSDVFMAMNMAISAAGKVSVKVLTFNVTDFLLPHFPTFRDGVQVSHRDQEQSATVRIDQLLVFLV